MAKTAKATTTTPTATVDAEVALARSPGEPPVVGEAPIMDVTLATISIDEEHARDSGMSEAELDELGANIRRCGLLEPIGVVALKAAARASAKKAAEPSHAWRLVYGRRRVLASMRAGLTELPARIFEGLSERQIQDLRTIENEHRADPNPIERAAIVARAIDEERVAQLKQFEPGAHVVADDQRLPDWLVERVAQRLDRSPKWVRDHAYLSRLTGKSRQLVIDGLLPVRHAREIAKLADAQERDELADMAAGYPDRVAKTWAHAETAPRSLEEIRDVVARRMKRLKGVPWELDVAFAGKPACATCPHNSANDLALFENDATGAPDEATCLNDRCFASKRAHVERAIEKALPKAVEKCTGADAAAPTPVQLRVVTPKGVKASTFAHRVRNQVAPPKPAAKKKAQAPTAKPTESPKAVAERALSNATADRITTILQALEKELSPVQKLYLWALGDDQESPWSAGWGKKKATSPSAVGAIEASKAPTLNDLARVLERSFVVDYWHEDLSDKAIERVAALVGVEVPPAPKLEDFLPAEGAAEPGTGKASKKAKAAAKKKAGSKKKGGA